MGIYRGVSGVGEAWRCAMIVSSRDCCAALIDDHAAISSSVRQQPLHQPVSGSILQTPLQGELG